MLRLDDDDTPTQIAFPMPDVKQRIRILRRATRKLPLHSAIQGGDAVDIDEIAMSCTGYTAADLSALVREALISAMRRHRAAPAGGSLEVLNSDFTFARGRIPPSVSRSASSELRKMRWEEIGGMAEAKRALERSLLWPLMHPSAFSRLGVRPPRGILLYGPPGCAKTSLALCGATAANVPFFHLDCASLYSMWVGEGEARLREVFRQARFAAPSIVFMDEIDSALPKRTFSGSGGGADHGDAGMRLLTTLLTEIDGLDSGRVEGVVLLAATNRPWDIDPALMRPGRIDVRCFVGPPDEEGRMAALRIATQGMPIRNAQASDASDFSSETVEEAPSREEIETVLRHVSKHTELYSGAELVALVREAAMGAIRRGTPAVLRSDFDAALRSSVPSTTEEMLQHFRDFETR